MVSFPENLIGADKRTIYRFVSGLSSDDIEQYTLAFETGELTREYGDSGGHFAEALSIRNSDGNPRNYIKHL